MWKYWLSEPYIDTIKVIEARELVYDYWFKEYTYLWMSYEKAYARVDWEISLYPIWELLKDAMDIELYGRIKSEEEEREGTYNFTPEIIMYYKYLLSLSPEHLHATYVSLLALDKEKAIKESIAELEREKQSYYKKHGTWYEKVLSYIK